MDFIKSKLDEGVLVITMDDPSSRNSLGPSMSSELNDQLDIFESDPDMRVLVLTGSDPAFCSGANVKGFDQSNKSSQQEESLTPWQLMDPNQATIHRSSDAQASRIKFLPWRLWQIQKPTIAALNGYAFGVGAGLSLCCDIRIASENAVFSESFVRLGLVPGDGSSWQLPRLVGLSNTFLMQYTGDRFDANQCLEMGLVSKVVSHEKLMEATLELAKRIAAGPTFSHGLIKYLIHSGLESTFQKGLAESNAALNLARKTTDHKEGARAFVEKRSPKFVGK
jgi:enoyl-CoA hydratase/carnithine racemase